jgi:hypothetical protein
MMDRKGGVPVKTIHTISLIILLLIFFSSSAPGNSWSKQINKAGRFKVLKAFNNEAVLDKETNLVWERSPLGGPFNWISAQLQCINRIVGNRKGWRLPTGQELASLVDPTRSNPALPPDHPFNNVSGIYWSSNLIFSDPNSVAWEVSFDDGSVGFGQQTDTDLIWCVRGGDLQ